MSDRTNKVFVKPAEGLKVVNPNATQRFVNPEGEELVRTTGVIRFMKSGDLVEGKQEKKKTEPKPKKEKKAPKPSTTNNEGSS